MQGDVIEIRTGAEILLLGRAGSFARLPRELTHRSRADAVLRRLLTAPEALRQIRLFWSRQYLAQACNMCSDHDILASVKAALQSGQMQAVVLPNRSPHRTQDSEGSKARPASAVQSSAVRALRAPLPMPGRTPSAGAPKPMQGPGAETSARTVPLPPRPIGQWSPEERLGEVIRLTVPKVPRAIGNEMLAFLTPESLIMAVGIAAFGAAANLTPYGWAADAIIVGIAFGFGGLAAVHGLHDLVDCVRQTGSAVSERDLDEAAEALARAVTALSTAGLMAVLHYRARRWGGGSGSESSPSTGEPALVKARRRPFASESSASEPTPQSPASAEKSSDLKSPGTKQSTDPAVLKQFKNDIDSLKTFKTFGMSRAEADVYLSSEEGDVLLQQLKAFSPVATPEVIYARAIDQLSTGVTAPEVVLMTSPLVKIIPRGQSVSAFSPFFTTMDDLKAAIQSGKNLADHYGLPLKSESEHYDVYEITPTAPATTFVTNVAPTEELGGLVQKAGGGLQCLVPNRGLWSEPKLRRDLKP